MKKEDYNSLNVLKYNYLPLTYWKNWFYNIGQFFRNIKYSYQRIVKGYCDCDVWNLDSYYSKLFYKTLRQLSNTTHGYPGKWSLEGKTFEQWQEYLNELAEHFLNTQEWNEDIPINKEIWEAYENMNKYVTKFEFIKENPEDLYSKLHEEHSNEVLYKRAQRKWLKKENKAALFREQEKNKAFDMMKEVFFDLWD